MSSPCLCPGEGAVDWVRLSSFPYHLVLRSHHDHDATCFVSPHFIFWFGEKKKIVKREHGKEEEGWCACMRVRVCCPLRAPHTSLTFPFHFPFPLLLSLTQIRLVFKDCVYTPADMTGFYFGMASIACWLVAQVPQFVQNFRLKSAEGLSPWFLAEWLMGGVVHSPARSFVRSFIHSFVRSFVCLRESRRLHRTEAYTWFSF